MLMIPKAEILYFQPFREYKNGESNILKTFWIRGSSKTSQSRKDKL